MTRTYRGKHIHRYIKVKDAHIELFRCAEGDCNYSLYPKQWSMLIGRMTYCWNCGDQFKMNEDSLKEDLPFCRSCKFADIDIDALNKPEEVDTVERIKAIVGKAS